MPHVELPTDLFQQIERSVSGGGSVDAFVREAVQRKLADVERLRSTQLEQADDDFDVLCDEALFSAPGTHLTRDQLHERD